PVVLTAGVGIAADAAVQRPAADSPSVAGVDGDFGVARRRAVRPRGAVLDAGRPPSGEKARAMLVIRADLQRRPAPALGDAARAIIARQRHITAEPRRRLRGGGNPSLRNRKAPKAGDADCGSMSHGRNDLSSCPSLSDLVPSPRGCLDLLPESEGLPGPGAHVRQAAES